MKIKHFRFEFIIETLVPREARTWRNLQHHTKKMESWSWQRYSRWSERGRVLMKSCWSRRWLLEVRPAQRPSAPVHKKSPTGSQRSSDPGDQHIVSPSWSSSTWTSPGTWGPLHANLETKLKVVRYWTGNLTLLESPVGLSDTTFFQSPRGRFHLFTLGNVAWFSSTQNWRNRAIKLNGINLIIYLLGLDNCGLWIKTRLLVKTT